MDTVNIEIISREKLKMMNETDCDKFQLEYIKSL